MNEKLKELAKQCDLPIGYENPPWAYEDEIQKFAKLIVDECCDVLYRSEVIINDHLGVEHPEAMLYPVFGMNHE